MAKSLVMGPNPTGLVETTLETTVPVLADFGVIEEGPGILKFRDLTAPKSLPTTVRLQQKQRANIYSGTSIDASKYLPVKTGTDTIIEVLGLATETDSVDTAYGPTVPYRVALSFTTPDGSDAFDASELVGIFGYLIGFLMSETDTGLVGTGVTRILNGVLRRD